jgi:hypothetical protein
MIGELAVTTTVLVALLGVISFFVWAADKTLFEPLILDPYKVRHGEVWRLVTWPIANEPSIWAVIDLALFWYFGRVLEGEMGRSRYLKYLVALIFIPAVVATGLDLRAHGMTYLSLAVFVAFVAENPNAPFFFGIQAKWLALVIVGVNALQLIGNRQNRELAFLFVTLAVALIGLRFVGLGEHLAFIPAPSRGRKKPPKAKRGKPARTFKDSSVVSGPWSGGGSGSDLAGQAEIDRLLDKIAASGLESLTPEERRRLNDASKRMRGE